MFWFAATWCISFGAVLTWVKPHLSARDYAKLWAAGVFVALVIGFLL